MIEFDFVLDRIGHLGRYQWKLILLVYWLGFPAGMHNLASVFYSAAVDYRCNVDPIDNETVYPGLNESDILNYTTPYDEDSGEYDTCYRYGYDLEECDGDYECVNTTADPIPCDEGYWYDQSEFTSTVVSTWDLVCDRTVLDTAATSSYFLGMWTGAILFGIIADNIGRRMSMFISNICCLVCGIGVAFSPWYAMFVTFRFGCATFSHGSFLIMCVYVLEITGKYRTFAGITAHIWFAFGYMTNSIISYFLRDWRYFYFVLSLSPIPYIFIHFWVPESPRYHFSHRRDEEGKRLSHVFAKGNKTELPEKVWEEAEVDIPETDQKKYSSVDVFKPKRMRWITINNLYCWFVVSLVYYGLSLNAGALAGDIFLNNALNGVFEIVADILAILFMDRIGRRAVLSISFLVGGIACIASTLCNYFADGNNTVLAVGTAMAFIGKMGASAGFAVIYNFTAELYPTVVRSNGLGVGSMAARWGSILSPFIIQLQYTVPWLPNTIFGVLSVGAGLTTLCFPETNNEVMTQTIEEAEIFYAGNHKVQKNEKEAEGKVNESYEEYGMSSTQL